jgi:hypothetical protein
MKHSKKSRKSKKQKIVVASKSKLNLVLIITFCRFHPASYQMGTRGSFLGGKAADHSPPSSAEVKMSGTIPPVLPNKPLWRGAQLKHRDNFTFAF